MHYEYQSNEINFFHPSGGSETKLEQGITTLITHLYGQDIMISCGASYGDEGEKGTIWLYFNSAHEAECFLRLMSRNSELLGDRISEMPFNNTAEVGWMFNIGSGGCAPDDDGFDLDFTIHFPKPDFPLVMDVLTKIEAVESPSQI